MFISIKNTGKISSAQVEIKGITVIAGANNTGKSTIGKVLFCLFNSFYNIDRQIERERKSIIDRIIESNYNTYVWLMNHAVDIDGFAESILGKKDVYADNKKQLTDDLRNFYSQMDENSEKYLSDNFLSDILDTSDKITQMLNVSDEEIFVTVFRQRLQAEFKMQMNNVYNPNLHSEIILKIKDREVRVDIKENKFIEISNIFSLNTEVIYMDDPLALDDLRRAPYPLRHRDHLRYKLLQRNKESTVKNAIGQIITEKKLGTIITKLNTVCNGEIVRNPKTPGVVTVFKENDSKTALDIRNVSAGIKIFAILKTLLQNGSLEDNGIMVLDEPEIHLHPEWQLVFAELIVLLQKEFKLHVLLNTHSPYFLDAIDVFSRKYGISDKCKYYLAEDAGKISTITDVSDDIDKIYAKLLKPFQFLDNERYQDA
jgi:predicted ATPase